MANDDIFAKYGAPEPEKEPTVSELEQQHGEQENIYAGETGPDRAEDAQTIDAGTKEEAQELWEKYGPAREESEQDSPEISVAQEGIDPNTLRMVPEEPSQIEQYAADQQRVSGFMNDGSLVGQVADRLGTAMGANKDINILAAAKAVWEKYGPSEIEQEEQQQERDDLER